MLNLKEERVHRIMPNDENIRDIHINFQAFRISFEILMYSELKPLHMRYIYLFY